jgi:peptidoglycan hydrolase CwlO-like protein
VQRAELERVRRERADLEQRMHTLQSTVHDLSEEVSNLERQASATSRLVAALDRQLATIDADVGSTTGRLDRAQRELDAKTVSLQGRLVDIYKRGPLYEAEVLLSAESFGDLVTRYKYLHELALRDRSLVRRVEVLRDDVLAQRALLVRLREELGRNREEKATEEERLRALEAQRSTSLVQARQQAARTRSRLAQIARDEERLSNVIASL